MTEIVIETERLILRPVDGNRDFEDFCTLLADEDVVRYMGGRVMDEAHAWRNLAAAVGHWKIRGYGFFSMFDKSSGEWVGRAGPWYPHGWYKPEIGWAVSSRFQCRGFATEAAQACVAHAFEELHWKEVVHVIHHQNKASMRVAEKLGARHTETVDGIPAITDDTCYVFTISKQAWSAQRSPD